MTVRIDKPGWQGVSTLIWQMQPQLTDDERDTFNACIMMSTDVWVGWVDEELVCIWGLCPPTLLSDQAYLWLYTTPKLEGNEFVFVRHSQIVMQQMLESYKVIIGHTAINATDRSKAWLRWLGAKLGEPRDGKIPFQIRAK